MDKTKELNILLKKIDDLIEDGCITEDFVKTASVLLAASSILDEDVDYQKVLQGLDNNCIRTMIGTFILSLYERIEDFHKQK